MLLPISLGKDEIERLSVEKHKNGYWLGVKLIVNPLMVMVSRPLATAAAFQEQFHVNIINQVLKLIISINCESN